ncbi:MAG: GNAT family N-acetyltransferase [Proteobacteria bacterium]|nr:GNAT family N-acetyltransferase [Pseudomonadota bacterium]
MLKIEPLALRPDLLPSVAGWIYEEWWRESGDASLAKVTSLLQPHLIPGRIPMTLVATLDSCAAGTATLIARDVGTEHWAGLSPWLAAVYVVPRFRRQGIGAALVAAIVDEAGSLGIRTLYLLTVGRESFYARLGWMLVDTVGGKTVMARTIAGSQLDGAGE